MRTYNLDIKTVDNKLIITIDKNKLDANYILNLMSLLHYETFASNDTNTYQEARHQTKTTLTNKQQTRKWSFAASVDLKDKLEGINLRDFAYE